MDELVYLADAQRFVPENLVELRVEGARLHAVVPYSALPEPMLARSERLPTRGSWAYEVKWDGFRAIVSTEGSLRVRSRRGWNLAEQPR
jgi:ATP-dependent DNA ligase